MATAMMIEFRSASQKFTDAPDPPWACASSTVDSPSTRLKAPNVKSTGSRLDGLVASTAPLENAVRTIQENGNRVTNRNKIVTTQATAKPKENFRFGFGVTGWSPCRVSPGLTIRSSGTAGSIVLIGFPPLRKVRLATAEHPELHQRNDDQDHEQQHGYGGAVTEVAAVERLVDDVVLDDVGGVGRA